MEAYVHMTGFVGGDVEVRNQNPPIASFRLASTPRVRRNGDWTDGPTTWITVTCYRSLAENAAASVHKGDPVVVVGRLRTNVYEKDGHTIERLTLEATTLGHDLTRGGAVFRRSERASAPEEREVNIGEILDAVEGQSRDADDPEEEAGHRRVEQAA